MGWASASAIFDRVADLSTFVHSPNRTWARRALRGTVRTMARHARDRNWRALKNHVNGYLAEPRQFPPGLTRCGTGWTRGRAYRDLQRRIEAIR